MKRIFVEKNLLDKFVEVVETYSSVRWNPPRRGGWSKFSFYGPFCVEESGRDGKERRDGERERERKRFWRFYNLSIRSSRLTGFMQFIAKRDTAELRSRFVISFFSSIDCELRIDGARSTTFLFSKGIGNIIIDVFLASMIKVKR